MRKSFCCHEIVRLIQNWPQTARAACNDTAATGARHLSATDANGP